MDQVILDLLSRLTAVELMLMHLQKLAYRNACMVPDDAERVIAASLEAVRDAAFSGFSDAAQSDQFAAAVEDRLSTLLQGVRVILETEKGRKT